jgi:hypothetical protein
MGSWAPSQATATSPGLGVRISDTARSPTDEGDPGGEPASAPPPGQSIRLPSAPIPTGGAKVGIEPTAYALPRRGPAHSGALYGLVPFPWGIAHVGQTHGRDDQMASALASPAPSHRRLWHSDARAFDCGLLREAIVLRGWSGVSEFARSNGLRESTVYAAVGGHPVRDRTALLILQALAKRDPIPIPLVG